MSGICASFISTQSTALSNYLAVASSVTANCVDPDESDLLLFGSGEVVKLIPDVSAPDVARVFFGEVVKITTCEPVGRIARTITWLRCSSAKPALLEALA